MLVPTSPWRKTVAKMVFTSEWGFTPSMSSTSTRCVHPHQAAGQGALTEALRRAEFKFPGHQKWEFAKFNSDKFENMEAE